MNAPSILRHSKAHRAAVARNESALWTTRVFIEVDHYEAMRAAVQIRNSGVTILEQSASMMDRKIRMVVTSNKAPIPLPSSAKVVKTEKVRRK